jgi:hypothetical protein
MYWEEETNSILTKYIHLSLTNRNIHKLNSWFFDDNSLQKHSNHFKLFYLDYTFPLILKSFLVMSIPQSKPDQFTILFENQDDSVLDY